MGNGKENPAQIKALLRGYTLVKMAFRLKFPNVYYYPYFQNRMLLTTPQNLGNTENSGNIIYELGG